MIILANGCLLHAGENHALSVTDHEGTAEIEHVIEADHTTEAGKTIASLPGVEVRLYNIYDTY